MYSISYESRGFLLLIVFSEDEMKLGRSKRNRPTSMLPDNLSTVLFLGVKPGSVYLHDNEMISRTESLHR